MDLAQITPVVGKIAMHVHHGVGNTGRFDFGLVQTGAPVRRSRIRLHVDPAVERMPLKIELAKTKLKTRE